MTPSMYSRVNNEIDNFVTGTRLRNQFTYIVISEDVYLYNVVIYTKDSCTFSDYYSTTNLTKLCI